MSKYNLPIDSISKYGVIYLNEESKMVEGEDGIDYPITEVEFIYKDEKGNNHRTKLDKQDFDCIFELVHV